jgi:hypothetical protein
MDPKVPPASQTDSYRVKGKYHFLAKEEDRKKKSSIILLEAPLQSNRVRALTSEKFFLTTNIRTRCSTEHRA